MLAGLLLAAGAWASEPNPIRLEPPELALGTLAAEGELTREVRVVAASAAVVERALSSCPCVAVGLAPEAPVTLAAGQQATLTLIIDPSSYAGAFRKTVFLQVRAADAHATTLVRLNITGTIHEEDEAAEPVAAEPVAPAPAEPLAEVIPHTPHMAWADMAPALVLFLTPDCDRCNWVRLFWLPRYRRALPQTKVYTVDLGSEAGLKLLLDVEKQVQVEPGQEAPAAWSDGKLVYGTAAIEQLLPAPPPQP